MLTEKTCLVLGAGASLDSGLPTGRQLIYLIADRTGKVKQDESDSFGQIKTSPDIYISALEKMTNANRKDLIDQTLAFSRILRSSYPNSIDEFLAANKSPYFLEIGKIGIVLTISQFERDSNLFSQEKEEIGVAEPKFKVEMPNKNWYQSLWAKVSGGCATLEQFKESLNNLTIVTFNYDRTLEHFIYKCAIGLFGVYDLATGKINNEKSIQDVIRQLKKWSIYGQIGRLAWQRGDTAPLPFGTQFRNTEVNLSDQLVASSKSIITLAEDALYKKRQQSIMSDLVFQLQEADKIHFLGFGFHPQNLQFFKFDPWGNANLESTVVIGGTCFGISEPRKKEIEGHLSNWAYGNATNPPQLKFIKSMIPDYIEMYL